MIWRTLLCCLRPPFPSGACFRRPITHRIYARGVRYGVSIASDRMNRSPGELDWFKCQRSCSRGPTPPPPGASATKYADATGSGRHLRDRPLEYSAFHGWAAIDCQARGSQETPRSIGCLFELPTWERIAERYRLPWRRNCLRAPPTLEDRASVAPIAHRCLYSSVQTNYFFDLRIWPSVIFSNQRPSGSCDSVIFGRRQQRSKCHALVSNRWRPWVEPKNLPAMHPRPEIRRASPLRLGGVNTLTDTHRARFWRLGDFVDPHQVVRRAGDSRPFPIFGGSLSYRF